MKLYKLIIRLLFNLDGLSPHHDFHHPKGLALFKASGLPAVHSTQGRGSLIPTLPFGRWSSVQINQQAGDKKMGI